MVNSDSAALIFKGTPFVFLEAEPVLMNRASPGEQELCVLSFTLAHTTTNPLSNIASHSETML